MVGCCLVAATVVACGTVEDNARNNGVSRQDAVEINEVVRSHEGVHRIYGYNRILADTIIVSTDAGYISVHRVKGRWRFGGIVIPDAPISDR
jgi:hypothetical protein